MTAETKDFEIVARFWNVVDGNERKTVIIFVEDGTKSTDDFGTIGRERQCQLIGISRADKDADIFKSVLGDCRDKIRPVHDAQHALACAVRNARVVVQYARNGCGGYACFLGNLVDALLHKFSSSIQNNYSSCGTVRQLFHASFQHCIKQRKRKFRMKHNSFDLKSRKHVAYAKWDENEQKLIQIALTDTAMCAIIPRETVS